MRPKMQNTTMPSTKDELLEIERSAQMMGNGGGNNDGTPSQQKLDSSCTSMYVEDDLFYNSSFSTEMSWQLSKASMDHCKNSAPLGGPRRNSVLMTPTGMLGGLHDIDFEDSDDDDSATPKPAPASGTGNPNLRPLVGGFAAAAYEAARADHFKKQQEKKPSA